MSYHVSVKVGGVRIPNRTRKTSEEASSKPAEDTVEDEEEEVQPKGYSLLLILL